tara:strand:+ start:367 stop:822 length:456 start_codon:yes stop_codon:yes gene_type:complete
MKNLIKFILVYFFIPISLVFSNQDDSKAIKNKVPKFLDEVSSKNPEAQLKINELKKEFYNEREKIYQSYESRIKSIKKARKEDVSELKKKYRKRLKRLRKKYPDIPDIGIDSKPRPKPIPPSLDEKNKKRKLRDRDKDKSLYREKQKDSIK